MNTAALTDSRAPSRMLAFIELWKLRLNALVILAALAGFFLALPSGESANWLTLLALGGGVLLSAGGASAINMALEAHLDAVMERTRSRPIPSGRVTRDESILFGAVSVIAGVALLWAACGVVAAAVSAATVISYTAIYTPLKTRSNINTIVGALPGALPVLVGWAAAGAAFNAAAWSLFTLIFVWQFPHFLAIATLYRDDYAKAGFRMLPVEDSTGLRTAHRALLHGLIYIPVSALPAALGLGGELSFHGNLVVAVLFFGCTLRAAFRRDEDSWRMLFRASLLVLPVQFGLLLIDHMTGP
jgi:protoheme IX farnesyltransferase